MYNTASVSKKWLSGSPKVKRFTLKHVGRNIFFVSNFIFMLVGTAFLSVGLTIVSKAPKVSKTDKIHAFIGICDVTLGVLGTTAIFKRNYIITLFLCFLLIVVPLHIGFGVEALLKINDKHFYEIAIKKAFAEIRSKIAENDIRAAYEMGTIQYHFKCCGINGYKDYEEDSPYLPRSCCSDYPKYCKIAHNLVFKRGCKNVVLEFTYLKRKITGILLLLVLIPLLAVAIIGVNLSTNIR